MRIITRAITRRNRPGAGLYIGGLLTFCLCSPVAAQQTTQPPVQQATPPAQQVPAGTPRIGEIVVIGNKTLQKDYIISESGHKVGDPCTDQTLAQMKTNLYQTGDFGWHSTDPEQAVRVHSEEPNPPNGLCKVVIEVDENDTVKGVTITGSGPIPTPEVRALLHVNEGKTVYNPNVFLRDTADIQDLYKRRGYVVTFGQDAGPDERNPSILNVPIIVTRVARIDIVKTHKTKRYVILREMKTKEGDYFNQTTFNNDMRRLYNLQIFEDVNAAEQDLGPGKVGLTVSLPEKRTGVVSAGIGYSSRSQLIGRAEITESNFRGVGETLNLLWEAGGIANQSSVDLGFTEPWLDKRHTTLNAQLYDRIIYRFANSLNNQFPTSTSLGSNNYFERRAGSTITVSRPFRDSYRAGFTFRGENVSTHSLGLSLLNSEILQDGPIYSISGNILHNSRDLDVDPVTGGFQNFSVMAGTAELRQVTIATGQTSHGPTGTVDFLKNQLELRVYIPTAGARRRTKPDEDKPTLALRTILGGTVGTLPFYEQFFAGGAESIRGFREDRFWGSNMVLGSIEYRQPLARKLKGVVFIDAGDAWGGNYSNVSISGFNQSGFGIHAGAGLGIRVGTPIGPLRLDFGVSSEGTQTYFSIGNVF